MLCRETICGMVRVEKQKVMEAARAVLEEINKHRRQYRRGEILRSLRTSLIFWKYVGRYVGMKKPTRTSELSKYLNSKSIFGVFNEIMMYWQEESVAKKLLLAANLSSSNTLWVSPEAARDIKLRKTK